MNNTEVIAILLYNNPGGRILGGMILGLIIGIISLVYNSTKKHFEKEKLKKNPYDIATYEKMAKEEIKHGLTTEVISKFKKMYRIDNMNFLANLYLAIHNYEMKEYAKAKIFLENFFEKILVTEKDLIKYAPEIVEYGDDAGLASYYYGHIFYMDGELEIANKYKKQAIELNKKLKKLELY